MRRNLIYHIYPLRSNDEWIFNLEELSKYKSAFNNNKVVAIVQDKNTVDVDCVKKTVEDLIGDVDFLVIENIEKLREVATFVPLLSRVYSLSPNEITFYGHSKGVFRKSGHWFSDLSNEFVMTSVKCWRNYMYRYCLSNTDKIDNILKQYACCGCFRYLGPSDLIKNWFFAGSFFWFNNEKLFSKFNWPHANRYTYGVESYLGERFELKESYCILGDDYSNQQQYGRYRSKYGHNDLYCLSEKEWRNFIKNEKAPKLL